MTLAAGTQVGSYQIERTLGRGGFGVVYIGIDLRLGRRAAIKQLLPEMSGNREVVERFFNEAKAAASINHPGIVEIYDVGWHSDGSAYFAMKLLDGETLHRRLEHGRLAIPLAATIARQVSGALVAAHARGIVHRDLKPDNIMLIRDDEIAIGERAVVLDFGIAKLDPALQQGGLHTQSGMMMGTPKYMSPEQCRGAGDVDHRTDLYALGCILFEMLAGRVPFVAEGAGEIMGMHQFVEPPPLRAFRPDVPVELEQLVNRLLAKRLDQRMQLMGELQAALQPFTAIAAVAPPRDHAVFPLPTQAEVAAGIAPTVPPTALAPPRTDGALLATELAPSSGALPHDAPTHAIRPVVTDDASRVLSSPIRIPEQLLAPPSPPMPARRSSKLPLVLGLVVAGGLAAAGIYVATRSSKPAPAIDAAPRSTASSPTKPATPAAPDPRRDELLGRCEQHAAEQRWDELARCASELDAIDHDAAKPYTLLATRHGAKVELAPRAASASTSTDEPAADCAEADALQAKGETAMSRGEFRAAFDALEAAYRCKPEILESFYLACCRSRNFDRARELFARFPEAKREDMARSCMKDGFDPRN